MRPSRTDGRSGAVSRPDQGQDLFVLGRIHSILLSEGYSSVLLNFSVHICTFFGLSLFSKLPAGKNKVVFIAAAEIFTFQQLFLGVYLQDSEDFLLDF